VALIILGFLFFVRSGILVLLGTRTSFSLMVLGVLLSAWYGGWGPGILVTFLGALLNLLIFLPPQFAVGGSNEDYLVTSIFIVEGIIVSAIGETRLRAAKARREFIAAASHDLKNPLAAVTSYAELIQMQAGKRELSPEDIALYGRHIEAEARLAVSLINDLSDLARFELARFSYKHQEFDLRAVLQEAVAAHDVVSASHAVVLTAPESCTIYGDRGRIRQVFDNVINNAIKYSPSANKVLVTLTVKKNEALVEIRDFGIGLAVKERRRIFERFYRAEGASRNRIQGTGLGLNIAQHIVAHHGGSISVVSTPGKGSVFTVRLPQSKPHNQK